MTTYTRLTTNAKPFVHDRGETEDVFEVAAAYFPPVSVL